MAKTDRIPKSRRVKTGEDENTVAAAGKDFEAPWAGDIAGDVEDDESIQAAASTVEESAAGSSEETLSEAGLASVASVVPPLEEIRAEPAPQSFASIAEETVAGSGVDPVAGIVEAVLAEELEVIEELGKEGLEAAESAASTFAQNFRVLAAEAKDYRRSRFESRAAFAGALLGAKTLQSAVKLQTSYAISSRANFMAHLMKISGLYWKFLGEASKPLEKAIAKADRAKP